MSQVVYGIGFFIFTLPLQYLLFKIRKNHNQGSGGIWVGCRAVLALCIIGLLTKNFNYLSAILGFVCANEIGKAAGWHQ